MPSNETKPAGTENGNIVEFKPEKGKKQAKPESTTGEKRQKSAKKRYVLTPTRIFTYLILVLLAVVLTVGVFPSFGQNQAVADSIVFGEYDKTPIEFKYGNYFYRQYQAQARQSSDSSATGAYQIWNNAFQNAVFHTALMKMADKIGIVLAEETLNKAIVESGAYDKDGKFDPQTYKDATVEYQNEIRATFKDNLPAQMVVNDIATLLSAPAETDYIVSLGNNARSFDYVAFTADVYPDDLTTAYAMANPALFTQIDISLISMTDEAALKALADQIQAGTTTFSDAAIANSVDSYAAEGGRSGVWYLHELQANFKEADQVNLLFSTKEGQVSQVFSTPSGFALYKVEKGPWIADFSDPDVLKDVKTYIGSKDAGMVTSYLKEQADAFVISAKDDFAGAAAKANLTVNTVAATPANVGGASYLSSFSYTDTFGALTNLSTDEQAMKALYTAPVGSVVEPLAVANTYVVAKVTSEEPVDEGMAEYMAYIYPYMAQSQSQQDLANAIFTSDKFKDNFLPIFLDKIMGYGTSATN